MENSTQAQQEKVFFQDANATVTQSRFVSGGKTYAMRNISSVTNYHIKKSRTMPIVVIAIGVLLMLSPDSRIAGVLAVIIGGLWLYLIKDEYSVKINSNSGEADALRSKDKAYIQKIVDALNDAMIHRG